MYKSRFQDLSTKVFTICSALMILFFFLPFVSVTEYYGSTGMSVMMLAVAIGAAGAGFGAFLIFVIFLGFPIAILIFWLVRPVKVKELLTLIFSLVLLGGYFLCLTIANIGMTAGSMVGSYTGSSSMISVTAWCVIAIIVLFIMIILSCIIMTNDNNNVNRGSSFQTGRKVFSFSVKSVMTIGSAIMILFFFLPMLSINVGAISSSMSSSFLGGMIPNIGVSASSLVFGISYMGMQIPMPSIAIFALLLILPLFMTVLWAVRGQGRIATVSVIFSSVITGMYVVIIIVFNFIIDMMGVAGSLIGSIAGSSYGSMMSSIFSITAWLVIAIIIGAIMILLSILLIQKRATMDTDVRKIRSAFAAGARTPADYRNTGYSNAAGDYRNTGYANAAGDYRKPDQSGTQSEADMDVCPNCGAVIKVNALFCSECGGKIARKSFCAGCGTELAPGAVFCPKCGKKQIL